MTSRIDTYSNTNRYYTVNESGKIIIKDVFYSSDILVLNSKRYTVTWYHKNGIDYIVYKKKGLFKRKRYFNCADRTISTKI